MLISEMLTSRAHKPQVYETTFINDIFEALHLIVIPQSTPKCFILLSDFIKIPCTKLGDIWPRV